MQRIGKSKAEIFHTKFIFITSIITGLLILVTACDLLTTSGQPNQEMASVEEQPALIRVGMTAAADIDDVIAFLAFEKLRKKGYLVEITSFAQPELGVTALDSDQIDISHGSTPLFLNAIQKGAGFLGVVEKKANTWSVMAKKGINTCHDLDKKTVAIHSEGAAGTAMLKAYIEENCPGIEPTYLIIPGSANRATALLEGVIDATPVDVEDIVRITKTQPEKFTTLTNFSEDLPDLMVNNFWISKEFAQENPEAVKAFIRALLEVNRRAKDDPEWLIEQVPKFIELDEDVIADLPKIIENFLSIDTFPENGGLTKERAQYSIGFYTETGRLELGLSSDEAFDFSYLNQVLQEIGIR